MVPLCTLFLTLPASAAGAQPEVGEKKMKVFILSGQSNTVGWGDSAKLPDELRHGSDRVLMFEAEEWKPLRDFESGEWQPLRPIKPANEGQKKVGLQDYTFGPEVSFAATIAEAWPDENIGIIKGAVGGTGILAWAPDWQKEQADRTKDGQRGPLYRYLMRKVELARNSREFEVVGFIWVQGGKDMGSTDVAKEYLQNLKALIEGVRQDTGVPDLPFVLSSPRRGDIPDDLAGLDPENVSVPVQGRPGAPWVVKAQFDAQTEIPRTKTVIIRDLARHPENVHYNTEGQLALGRLLAEGYLELVDK